MIRIRTEDVLQGLLVAVMLWFLLREMTPGPTGDPATDADRPDYAHLDATDLEAAENEQGGRLIRTAQGELYRLRANKAEENTDDEEANEAA